jgi:hypothetical protein
MGSQARFENKNISFYFEKRSSLLLRWRCSCKLKSCKIDSSAKGCRPQDQSDCWVMISFGQFFENYRSSPNVLATFSAVSVMYWFLQKKCKAAF